MAGKKYILSFKLADGTTHRLPLEIPSGEPGKDYVLTPADKTEIAEMAAELVEVPESSGGISVTGATVGQTVKIAEVDENGVPTAWEPVDFPSGGGGPSEDSEEFVVVAEGGETFIGFSYEELGMTDCFDCKAFQVWGHNLGYASEKITDSSKAACFKLNNGTYFYGAVFNAGLAVRKDNTDDGNTFTSDVCFIPRRYTEKSEENRRKEVPQIRCYSINTNVSTGSTVESQLQPSPYHNGFYIWLGTTDAVWMAGSTFHVKIWR